jgi:hypothetical protein
MGPRSWLISLLAGIGGAAIVLLTGPLWTPGNHGSAGVSRDTPPAKTAEPAGSAIAKWQTFGGQAGYNPSCDYRVRLIIPPEKAKKISIDLSRYAEDSSFIYPTIVNANFLQAVIMEPGEPISVDISGKTGGDCQPGRAVLGNLPGMCFDTKIEQRC